MYLHHAQAIEIEPVATEPRSSHSSYVVHQSEYTPSNGMTVTVKIRGLS